MKLAHTLSLALTIFFLMLSNNGKSIISMTANAATSSFDCSTVSQIPQTECEALLSLYNSTNGDYWVDKTNWLVTNIPCDWFGISCSDGSIIQIILDQNQLSGTLPVKLSNLTNIEHLSMEDNQLTGTIPSEYGNLSQLRLLSLGSNELSGNIPPEIGNLSNLVTLSLNYNQLSGNIPNEIGNLTELRGFYIWGNQISGSIPPELGNLSKLEALSLAVNNLSGNVPDELGNLSGLKNFYLHYNPELIGSLPSSFVKLQNLEWFYFSSTGLCEPPDTAFQTWISSIPNLQSTGVICVAPASLTMNYTTGSPGSFFTVYGSNFPADTIATILINGYTLGTIQTNSSGDYLFILNTEQADEGYYTVTTNEYPSASTSFVLNSTEPVRPQEETSTILTVPSGIVYAYNVYLTFVYK